MEWNNELQSFEIPDTAAYEHKEKLSEEEFANKVLSLANKCAFPNTMRMDDIPKEHFVSLDLADLHFGYDKRNIKANHEEIEEMEKQLYEFFPEAKSPEDLKKLTYKKVPLYKVIGFALVYCLVQVEKEES